MQGIIYRRNPVQGILSIILSIFFFIILLLNFAIDSPMAFVPAVILVLNVISAGWLYKNPFAVILKGKVNFYFSITRKKNFSLGNLKQVRRISEKKIELLFSNEKSQVVNLGGMHPADRNRFFNKLRGLDENETGPEVYLM